VGGLSTPQPPNHGITGTRCERKNMRDVCGIPAGRPLDPIPAYNAPPPNALRISFPSSLLSRIFRTSLTPPIEGVFYGNTTNPTSLRFIND